MYEVQTEGTFMNMTKGSYLEVEEETVGPLTKLGPTTRALLLLPDSTLPNVSCRTSQSLADRRQVWTAALILD